LGKLACVAQDGIKLDEFTAIDRTNLLDLFVNNEDILLRIHALLFNPVASQGQAS